MAVSAQVVQRAKDFVATLGTDSVDAFERALALKGLETLTSAGGIPFWDFEFKDRNAVALVIKDGANKAECVAVFKDRCARVNIGQPLPKPFVTDEFDRSGWFDYFFTEAADFAGKESTGLLERETLTAIANIMFFKRVQSNPKNVVALTMPYDAIDAGTFKEMLRVLLETGFHRIPATQQQAVAGDVSDATILAKMLWAGKPEEVEGTAIRVVDVAYKWRGDSRPFADIQTASGFTTKANSERYAKLKNVSADWNPFKDDAVRSFLWYRRSNTDNCLYNTISVGKANDWKTYLAYPLIKLSGGRVAGLPGYKGKRKVMCMRSGLPGSHYQTVQVELPVSVTYIYLFVFAGLALDTGALQGLDSYPEIGVGAVPFKNVYGSIRCTRYHLGDEATVTDDDGCIVRLDRDVVTDDNNKTIRASYGEALFTKMNEAYAAVLRTPPVGIKWQASGAGYSQFDPMSREFTVGGARYRVLNVPD